MTAAASPDQEPVPIPAKDAWSADWFETQACCLFCCSGELDHFLDGVCDWFFRAVPGDFAFDKCTACGSLVLARRPVPERIGLAYQAYYTHADEKPAVRGGLARRLWQLAARGYARRTFGGSRSPVDRALAAMVSRFPARRLGVDAHHRFLPAQPSRILDFGCGNGDFLLRARALGHDVVGVDFDAEALTVAASRGLPVHSVEQAARMELADSFDMITANHVVEHVAQPVGLLRDFHGWLKVGGKVFIETPNAAAAGIARHGRFWRGFEAPRHFSVPSKQGLSNALGHAGFTDIRFHDRRAVAAGMDAIAAVAAQDHPGIGPACPVATHLTGCEFITLTAVKS